MEGRNTGQERRKEGRKKTTQQLDDSFFWVVCIPSSLSAIYLDINSLMLYGRKRKQNLDHQKMVEQCIALHSSVKQARKLTLGKEVENRALFKQVGKSTRETVEKENTWQAVGKESTRQTGRKRSIHKAGEKESSRTTDGKHSTRQTGWKENTRQTGGIDSTRKTGEKKSMPVEKALDISTSLTGCWQNVGFGSSNDYYFQDEKQLRENPSMIHDCSTSTRVPIYRVSLC